MRIRNLLLAVAMTAAGLSLNACVTDSTGTSGVTHQPSHISPTSIPEAITSGDVHTLQSGISYQVYTVVTPNGSSQRIWLYYPDPMPTGELPLVIVPPAGGRIFSAPILTHRDQPEHLPYVRAGFAVVSFSIQGELARSARTPEILEASRLYRAGEAGTNSGRSALNFALSRLPVDTDRVYAAGHSSAGKLVLLMAATDKRIRAVAAYSPVADVTGYLRPKVVSALDRDQPGYKAFLEWSSPTAHINDLTVPVFLFHAMDDKATKYNDTLELYEML
jgi:dipeptidyl aminopeptidase/acylaminoacyl peptidase